MTENQVSTERIENIDAIRFMAAIWVAMQHGALPLKTLFSDTISRFIAAVLSSTFNGSAAVMVFFIVSGICIHLPYADAPSLPIGKFLLKRYLRIGIPLLSIIAATYIVGPTARGASEAVLWSVYAEIIYYSLYPALFTMAKAVGWGYIIASTSVASAVIVLLHLDYTNVQQFGGLTWLWGLPVWISGCYLAEMLQKKNLPRVTGGLNAWRLATWGTSVVAAFALYPNLPITIGAPLSLLPFSIIAFFWLVKELQNQSTLPIILRKCGAASYSLYLVHNVVIVEVDRVLITTNPATLLWLRWGLIAALTYAFYRLIEAPAHRLAREAARNLTFAPVGSMDVVNRRPSSRTGSKRLLRSTLPSSERDGQSD